MISSGKYPIIEAWVYLREYSHLSGLSYRQIHYRVNTGQIKKKYKEGKALFRALVQIQTQN